MMLSAVLCAVASGLGQIQIDVDPTNVTHSVNPLFMGCHSDSGFTHEPRGFYAQMVLGESFETLPPDLSTSKKETDPLPSGLHPLKNGANGGRMRHCDFDLYADTDLSEDDGDFWFTFDKALDGTANSISIQSTNFKGKYVGLETTQEQGRCGILNPVSNAAASFTVVAALDKNVSNGFSLMSNDPKAKGLYLAINNGLQGSCAHAYPAASKDIALLSASAVSPSAATWSFDNSLPPPPPPPAPPQQYSPWNQFVSPGVSATFEMDSANVFHGLASQKISFTSGSGVAAVGNRGLGNEGLFIEANRDYDGYFFAKSDKPVTLIAQIINHKTNETLASATIPFAGGNWTMLNFTMNTTGGTTCVDGSSDPSVMCGKMTVSHICVSCGGQFQVGLAGPGEVNIDYVYAQPGEWGRVNGLGVLKSGVDTLKAMGVTTIRLGGSFTDPAYYFWKNWRGKPWERPSLGAEWGKELISGWGPFEFIDMCAAAGIEPVMTTTGVCDQCTPEDMGDLVEYAHGGADTTWGAQRIQDGHPDPYDVKFFELGNEQYNPMYADQVANMEARASKLGLPKTLFYMNPNNAKWLTPADAAKVEAVGIKDHAVMDEHVGGGGGVEIAQAMFTKFPNYTMGAVNAETNAGIHTMSRAMMEANDLNDWFNCDEAWCSRLHFRTASFCTERCGHFDAFDQGISFFLPNMSWIQPPGYVHQMISNTWASKGVAITVAGGGTSASAQLSDDSKTVYVRVASTPGGKVQITLKGKPYTGTANATTISASDLNAANSPANPTYISPEPYVATFGSDGTSQNAVPENSFTVFEIPV